MCVRLRAKINHNNWTNNIEMKKALHRRRPTKRGKNTFPECVKGKYVKHFMKY